MPQNEIYHLEREGFFSKNRELMAARRLVEHGHEKIVMPEEPSFTSFSSLADFQSKLKAPLVLPIVYSTMILNAALSAVKNIALTLAHMVVLDFAQADRYLTKAIIDVFFHIAGFALCAIVDTVASCLQLVVNILATVGFYVASFVTGNDVLVEQGLLVDLEDYAESYLETKAEDIQRHLNSDDGLDDYTNNQSASFLQSFTGTDGDNLPTQLKACMVVPISCVAGTLGAMLGVVKHTSLAAINLTMLDFGLCWMDLTLAWHDTGVGLYLALSGILDTLYVAAQTVTRTFGTLDEEIREWVYSP